MWSIGVVVVVVVVLIIVFIVVAVVVIVVVFVESQKVKSFANLFKLNFKKLSLKFN